MPTTAVNAALVLLADHELATSTMAVRVAASVRADPYDALLAGLATLAGPLHGGASQQAYELLAMAERDGAARALDDMLRERGIVPGFGHTVYTSGDPRFGALLELAEPLLSEDRRDLVREVVTLAEAHGVPRANCDLALAVLSWGTGHAARYRPHPLRRGPRRRLDGPLPRGAGRAPAPLPRPRRLQRLSRAVLAQPDRPPGRPVRRRRRKGGRPRWIFLPSVPCTRSTPIMAPPRR